MNTKYLLVLFLSFSFLTANAQQHKAFQEGEWIKFRVHYGPVNAGYATIQVEKEELKGKPVYHLTGRGKSTGMVHLFFEVKDNYESYVDYNTGKPYRFIRQIDEGGHTKDLVIDFDHQEREAVVYNKKRNTKKSYKIGTDVHDILSAFYYLRNNLDVANMKVGEEVSLNMFFDNENYPFKLEFLGREVVNTKVGKIAGLKFRPHVMAGRVFKEKESLTLWVSDDENRIPLKIEADLAVGSLDADIEAFKGLKYPLNVIQK